MNDNKNNRDSADSARAESRPSTIPKAMSGLGVCSVVCGLFGFLFPLASFFGIGAAVSGITRDRRDLLCLIGLCLSLIGLVTNIIDMVHACGSGELSFLMGS